MRIPRPFPALFGLSLAVTGLSAGILQAQSLIAPERIPLESLTGFKLAANSGNWAVAGGIGGDPRMDRTLTPQPGTGILVCNPTPTARANLFTTWEHSDLELELDFLIPPQSNSGLYLQGRYEVQILDSWGKNPPTPGDVGGIYQRWDVARGKGNEGYEGAAPRANAARAPGLWQHLRIEFQAPRFDSSGRKVKNAKFVKVVLNDYLIHENVEVTGPTRSSAFQDEKPAGPLMIQGDHGPVAIRAFKVKRFDATARIAIENLAYRIYEGDFKTIGDYDTATPTREGALERFSHVPTRGKGRYGLVITGTLIAPRAGEYAFSGDAFGFLRLMVGGQAVITPLDRSSAPGKVTLAAGAHPFRVDYFKTGGDKQHLEIVAEGPGLAPQTLTAPDSFPSPKNKPKTLAVDADAKQVRVQRSFVPFDPKKRLYAINVGTPAGVHYAYDFDTGALLRSWRGQWIDAVEMWENRGSSQLANPSGPALVFNARPTVALLEFPEHGGWPEFTDALWSSQGYVLEPNGQPVFLASLSSLKIRDRIAAATDGRGLARTLALSGTLPSWSAWVLLALGETITPQPNGRGWIVGDRDWFLDWPADSAHNPVVVTRNGAQQLVVRLSDATLHAPLSYSIVW